MYHTKRMQRVFSTMFSPDSKYVLTGSTGRWTGATVQLSPQLFPYTRGLQLEVLCQCLKGFQQAARMVSTQLFSAQLSFPNAAIWLGLRKVDEEDLEVRIPTTYYVRQSNPVLTLTDSGLPSVSPHFVFLLLGHLRTKQRPDFKQKGNRAMGHIHTCTETVLRRRITAVILSLKEYLAHAINTDSGDLLLNNVASHLSTLGIPSKVLVTPLHNVDPDSREPSQNHSDPALPGTVLPEHSDTLHHAPF
ncbi:WD repeat domain-containing protein [Colletotrichum cuscutae]|uniref:WD repeat domain-containing protein n=1 Tax=Colletotrichum cuscutae TaxID=1209917 RepID=A0AAI9XFK9_9PEZI|nr:WD repeat domain-containing protein [Colletotrichum cuscutae]